MRFSIFLLFLVILCLNLNSQEYENEHYIYVEALPGSPLPLSDSLQNSESTDEELNQIFNSFDVFRFMQPFPGAENPELITYHEIHLNGDIDSFIVVIENNNYFGKIYKVDYPQLLGCTNPIAINDYWVVQNWVNNYALEMIEAQCAWTITTGNDVEVAVVDTEIDSTHDDLQNQLIRIYGPPVTSNTPHGTSVAGVVAAQTNNNIGVASIGYNTKISFYRADLFTLWSRIWKAYQDGARIINISWKYIGFPPNVLAVKEMVANGTVLTLGAGNDNYNPYHSAYAGIEGAINVSGVGPDNKHGPTGQAHNPYVDLCAPSINVTTTADSNLYTGGWGTSFAAPQVAGTVALMRSVNPCLPPGEVENMLKVTCDTIADGASFIGLVGAGRLNAYKAVQKAHSANSTILDLYIKDRYEDFGISGGYHWQADRDNSPDIWVRRQADGLAKQVHQDPEYQTSSPAHVYIRVRNKSCDTSDGTEKLKLYWSKASGWSSWPQNWDGTQPNIGNVIDSITIPILEPGKDTILHFTWNILNPHVFNNWATCLLARIENSPIDPITIYPGRLDDDVYFNNNIAWKNLTIIDSINGLKPFVSDEVMYPAGRYMFIGNPGAEPANYDVAFSESLNVNSSSITEEAEIKVILDSTGWGLLKDAIVADPDFEIYSDEERSFVVLNPDSRLEDVYFPSNTRIPVYIGFSFLTDEVENEYYEFHVRQYLSSVEGEADLLGGLHFVITRKERSLFYADAGNDQKIKFGETATLSASNISEPASYRWYSPDGDILGEGINFQVNPEESTVYTLEVIAEDDAYKDYDDVMIEVQHNWINYINPNPANTNITVGYHIEEELSSSSIIILNNTATISYSYPMDSSNNQINIDVSHLNNGWYTAVLLINGVAEDSETLIIQ